VIPESPAVLASSNIGTPIVLDGNDPAALAYNDTVDRYLGGDRPMRFVEPEKRGLLKRLFGS